MQRTSNLTTVDCGLERKGEANFASDYKQVLPTTGIYYIQQQPLTEVPRYCRVHWMTNEVLSRSVVSRGIGRNRELAGNGGACTDGAPTFRYSWPGPGTQIPEDTLHTTSYVHTRI